MCTRVTIESDGISEMVEDFFADLNVIPLERLVLDPMRAQIVISDSDSDSELA